MAPLRENDPAPDFTALLETGETITLSAFKGTNNIVLYFYPRDFSPGCTREACSFRDQAQDFQRLGAEVFGISLDSSDSHRKFREYHQLPFTLIVDNGGGVSRAYGALRAGGWLPNKRVTYVIDRRGIIRRIIRDEMRMERHVIEALEALAALEAPDTLSTPEKQSLPAS